MLKSAAEQRSIYLQKMKLPQMFLEEDGETQEVSVNVKCHLFNVNPDSLD